MNRDPFDVALRKQLRQQMNDHTDALARGECANIEDYRSVVGTIRGLAIAEALLLDLAKKYNGPDEDDEPAPRAAPPAR